jgi:hypothetical protein
LVTPGRAYERPVGDLVEQETGDVRPVIEADEVEDLLRILAYPEPSLRFAW